MRRHGQESLDRSRTEGVKQKSLEEPASKHLTERPLCVGNGGAFLENALAPLKGAEA